VYSGVLLGRLYHQGTGSHHPRGILIAAEQADALDIAGEKLALGAEHPDRQFLARPTEK